MPSVRVSTIVGGPRRRGKECLLETLLLVTPNRRGYCLRRFAELGLDLETKARQVGMSTADVLDGLTLAPPPTPPSSFSESFRVAIRLMTGGDRVRSALATDLLSLDAHHRPGRIRYLARCGAALTMAACHARMPEVAFLDQLIGEKAPQNHLQPPSGARSSQAPQATADVSRSFGDVVERPANAASDTSDALEMGELLDMMTLAD